RELGVPLPRLVHQPRVLERDAEAAGERLEKLLVRLGEGVLAVDVLERDNARRVAAGDERDEEGRLRHLSSRDDRASVALPLDVEVLSEQQRLPRLEHVFREADWLVRLHLLPL